MYPTWKHVVSRIFSTLPKIHNQRTAKLERVSPIYLARSTHVLASPVLSRFVSEPFDSAMLHLDGRTLEGGGQLVRNAVALSALTSKPVTISKIRGGRPGRGGLRPSHTAAVNFLLDVCGGKADGACQGSSELTFYPRGREAASATETGSSAKTPGLYKTPTEALPIKPQYDIRLKTPGSVFLIFQALYPYLLYAGARANTGNDALGPPAPSITLNITGGTNLSACPTYDYFTQVLIPNFAKLGMPQLTAQLKGRGWSTGKVQLGTVALEIEPLQTYTQETRETKGDGAKSNDMGPPESAARNPIRMPMFPGIDLCKFERGDITQIDITVLAPDISFEQSAIKVKSRDRNKHSGGHKRQEYATPTSGEEGYTEEASPPSENPNESQETPSGLYTIRHFLESCAMSTLSREVKISQLRKKGIVKGQDNVTFPGDGSSVSLDPKINLHHSEGTADPMHISLFLVAHTSTGFRIGRDALYGQKKDAGDSSHKPKKPPGKKEKGQKSTYAPAKLTQADLELRIEDMVEQCVADLMYELNNGDKRYLDSFMRDQVVVFQALGKMCAEPCASSNVPQSLESVESPDEEDLSLHTRTAVWVCEQMLGVEV